MSAGDGISLSYKNTAKFLMVRNYLQVAVNPASLTTGTNTTGTVTVSCALGDFIIVAVPLDLQGMQLTAYVSAANTVTWVLNNVTAGTIDLANSTWTFVVLPIAEGQGVGI